MKSIKQQYIDLREGNMTQANFMRNLRMTLPQYVTNLSSFEDSVQILKNKGILTEADTSSEGKWKTVTGKDLYAHFKEIDNLNLNGQEVLVGIDFEMQKNQELTKAEAAKIVIKNLKKNPIYYTAEDMSNVEGYEIGYIGGKSSNAEARQMQPLDKNMGNIVDKKMGMQPVKDIEKVKKDSDKGGETNKMEKGVSLMSLIAKSVRGVQKMDATGEKMKKITMKEGMGEYTFNGHLKSGELSKLKTMLPDAEIDTDEEPGQTVKTTVSSAKYNNKSVEHAVKSVLGMLETSPKDNISKANLGSVKERLKEMIRKQLKEMADGMEPMSREDGSSYMNENELSSDEQEIVDDILNTLNEGMFGDVLDKIKLYAKKGLMTAGIIGALLSAPNFSQAQQQQIKQVAGTEMSSTQEKGGKEWEQIKKAVSKTSPKFINVRDDKEMGIKSFQSLNWGAHKSAGSSAGISISYEKGSGVIDIEVTHVIGKDKKGYDQIIKNLQDMGVKDKYSVQSENGFSGQIPVSKANDVINFVNNNLSLLKENNIDSVVNEALKKFRKGN